MTKRERGRPPHEPTEQSRREVEGMAGVGVPQDDIAMIIGISQPTLAKHYSIELDRGMAKADAAVRKSLFQMATQDKNVTAAIFWAKVRLGWTEKNVLDVNIQRDPSSLSDAELAAIVYRGSPRVAQATVDPEEPDGMVH